MRLPRRAALLLSMGLTSCASYNALWNAEQHARDARRLELLGQTADARAQWAQAATKAATIAAREGGHRATRAGVLQVEALAHAGVCQDIGEPLARARTRAAEPALRERIDLADAECAVTTGDLVRAESLLARSLASRNADRRSRAEYIAGQAAAERYDFDAALTHFARSREPGAAGRGLVDRQRARIARAKDRSDLAPIAAELTRLLPLQGTEEAGRLLALLTQLQHEAATTGARFRLAELARDSLQAPALAGNLFLEAAADSASLFAPKALLAALPLVPERHDSIVGLLDSRYAVSPYTRAFRGEPSVAYAAAEDSLAREMGTPLVVRYVPVPAAERFRGPQP
jgi:hypothetical protein